jgi:hypothetical protein
MHVFYNDKTDLLYLDTRLRGNDNKVINIK